MSIPTSRSTATSASIDAAGQDTFTTDGGHVNADSIPAREMAEIDQDGRRQLSWPLGDNYGGRSEAGTV